MTTFIYPYSRVSNSAKLLARALEAKMYRPGRTRIRENDFCINWGASNLNLPFTFNTVLNIPMAVNRAINKQKFYEILKRTNIPTCETTIDINQAKQWVRDGHTVIGRNLAAGSQGRGITVYLSGSDPAHLQQHKFYTKYFKHTYEMRIHCFKNGNLYLQRKAKVNDWEEHYGHNPTAKYIKTHDNGYVYVIGNLNPRLINLTSSQNYCLRALEALGLDFGAFDVLIKQDGSCCILECNTAPGIEGTTVNVYKNYIKQILQNQ